MGVTIRCKKTGESCDLGYGGFGRFRNKVAELCSPEFGEHYKKLSEPDVMFILGEEKRKAYFEEFDKITNQMIAEKRLNIKVADFCLQFDCDGSIHYGACKVIYEAIKDYDDDIVYGYAGRSDRAMFRDLKAIIKDCIDNKCDLVWY